MTACPSYTVAGAEEKCVSIKSGMSLLGSGDSRQTFIIFAEVLSREYHQHVLFPHYQLTLITDHHSPKTALWVIPQTWEQLSWENMKLKSAKYELRKKRKKKENCTIVSSMLILLQIQELEAIFLHKFLRNCIFREKNTVKKIEVNTVPKSATEDSYQSWSTGRYSGTGRNGNSPLYPQTRFNSHHTYTPSHSHSFERKQQKQNHILPLL